VAGLAAGADGCATATALDNPNAVVVSPDGRTVYATARNSNSIVAFARDLSTGALAQVGCWSATDAACTSASALGGADTVTISRDGTSVYVGAFTNSAVTVFARNPATGTLVQTGCLSADGAEGCTAVPGLQNVEGITASPDGANVYAAAALSNSVFTFARSTSGALTPTGCAGAGTPTCTPARALQGPNDLVVSPDGSALYVTSVLSNGMAIFTRGADGALTQATSAAACIAALPAAACSLGRGFSGPEGLAVSPDGRTVYTASFGGAIAVFDTTSRQPSGRAGCVTTRPSLLCQRGRALLGASSVEVSPDGRNVYVASYQSGSVTVFRRATG
jgi:DNA-binding beta-propeller fold protein YncE